MHCLDDTSTDSMSDVSVGNLSFQEIRLVIGAYAHLFYEFNEMMGVVNFILTQTFYRIKICILISNLIMLGESYYK